MNLEENLKKLFEEEVEKISKLYKAEPQEVKALLDQKIEDRQKELLNIPQQLTTKQLQKNRIVAEIIKTARKEIYYHLRQYYKDKELFRSDILKLARDIKEEIIMSLAENHISTRERLPYIEKFNRKLAEIIQKYKIENVVDIGCGINPLLFPFEDADIKKYIAIDKDPLAIEALQVFAKRRLEIEAKNMSIEDLDLSSRPLDKTLVIMLKTVAVVKRSSPESFIKLTKIPSEYVLITGNRSSLTKNLDIELRERRILKEYVKLSGREEIEEFEIENEFGYLAKN